MTSGELIMSEDTYDLIVSADEGQLPLVEPVCVQPINETYAAWYYDRRAVPPLSIGDYSYTSIPKLYSLMDSTSLDVSGILAIQNQPTLALRGQGVLIGIVDTGIDYQNPLFWDSVGNCRILSIWDQNESSRAVESNQPVATEWLLYGREYTREDLERAMAPRMDTNGHGTFLASLAAGGEDADNDFVGAAPESELVVVRLKEAKENLRAFYYMSDTEPLYQENDIMAGVAYLDAVARREGKPMVILIGLGSNQGSHRGTEPLSLLLDEVSAKAGRCVVVCAGNQAVAKEHYYGEMTSALQPYRVEVAVEEGILGFCGEVWAYAPELVRVEVQSPTGQRSQGGFPVAEESQTTRFVFENTVLTMDYRIAGKSQGDLLVFLRFSRPSEGIWTLLVYPQQTITGGFHIWLPIQPEAGPRVSFIQPNPDTTITAPGMAALGITAGAYDGLTGARYLGSGRGYSGTGQVKPELCAPGVDVTGAGIGPSLLTEIDKKFASRTGTSGAAAITAGAAALALEWGILRGNAPGMNGVEVRNFLIRGCNRDLERTYPNREWGYGRLDLYHSFEVLRK